MSRQSGAFAKIDNHLHMQSGIKNENKQTTTQFTSKVSAQQQP
jgi:hypothetical protein